MKNTLYDHGYHTKWKEVYVEKRERYKTSVTDFHEHDFYEINLILSGNVKVLVANQTVGGTESKIVLAKPNSPHFVSCKPDVLYSSLYLVFSEDFIKSYDIESMNLLSVFGGSGAVFTPDPTQVQTCEEIINMIDKEESIVRKRFLVLYLLSYIDDIAKPHSGNMHTIPEEIYEVLTYINKHYMDKLLAQDLANMVHIGRTTLMTQFKKTQAKLCTNT